MERRDGGMTHHGGTWDESHVNKGDEDDGGDNSDCDEEGSDCKETPPLAVSGEALVVSIPDELLAPLWQGRPARSLSDADKRASLVPMKDVILTGVPALLPEPPILTGELPSAII